MALHWHGGGVGGGRRVLTGVELDVCGVVEPCEGRRGGEGRCEGGQLKGGRWASERRGEMGGSAEARGRDG